MPSQPSRPRSTTVKTDHTHSLTVLNAFPNPYTLADAESWITIATARQPLRNFAVCHADGTYAGGIGLKPIGDVEYRTMVIGYWFGQAHWGAGLATDAVIGFSRWCFENSMSFVPYPCFAFPFLGRGRVCARNAMGKGRVCADGRNIVPELLRLEASVFGPNTASARVLEKAGYTLEGVRRKAACKNGEVIDMKMYALLKEECLGVTDEE